MLTRYEMEEALVQYYDTVDSPDYSEEDFEGMPDEDVKQLFEQVFPSEDERRNIEKKIRSYED